MMTLFSLKEILSQQSVEKINNLQGNHKFESRSNSMTEKSKIESTIMSSQSNYKSQSNPNWKLKTNLT